MLNIVHDDELIIDYLTMVFGEFRGSIYEVAGKNKQLDEYLLFPRAKHFRSKVTSAITLRVSTKFNGPRSCAKLGTHFYFHSTALPVHFALHLDPGRQDDMPANSFHFTFDDVFMKNSFKEKTGLSWCMQVELDWNDKRSKDYLVYSSRTLDTIDDVYMPFLISETSQHQHQLDVQTAVNQVHLFLDAFLDIANGLVSVYTQENLLGQASLIPPFTRAIEFLYSRRSLANDHFIKLNNEGLKE